MDARTAIREAIDSTWFVVEGYLADLTDDEMLHRPCPGGNHIKWQLGHLIASEHMMLEKVFPGSMPPLPDGFEVRYAKNAASSDAPGDFDSKDDLLKAAEGQRKATLELLSKVAAEDLDRPSGIDYAPTVAAVFLMQSTHWMMHAGQWAVVRRMLGRKALY
jgi:hypothetical protein